MMTPGFFIELAILPFLAIAFLSVARRYLAPSIRYVGALIVALRLVLLISSPLALSSFWISEGGPSPHPQVDYKLDPIQEREENSEIALSPTVPKFSINDRTIESHIKEKTFLPGLSRWIVAVWVLGALLYFARLAYFHLGFHLRLSRSRTLCPELSTHSPVPIFLCPQIAQPFVTGLIHPAIYLPKSLTGEIELSSIRHIIDHEAAHLARGDLWTEWVFHMARGIHWWNPAVHFLHRMASRDRELACDRIAKSRTTPEEYGETLYQVMNHSWKQRRASRLPALSMANSSVTIEHRIESLFSSTQYSRKAAACAILAISLLAVFSGGTISVANQFPRNVVLNEKLPKAIQPPESPLIPTITDRNGIPLALQKKGSRSYPFQSVGSHLLGYRHSGNGGFGMEKYLEQSGDNQGLSLTIDLRFQHITDSALRMVGRGAVVILDPRNGEVLALSSFPDFDPNDFSPSISRQNYEAYVGSSAKPMFNRATMAAPIPGSTFGPVVALALASNDRMNFVHECKGGISFGNKFMKCWIASHKNEDGKPGSHGPMTLQTGLMHSCNSFLYAAGVESGREDVIRIARALGLGTAAPFEISTQSGSLPTDESLEKQNVAWSEAHSALLSIGQGAIEATPLQLAAMIGGIANGGKPLQPLLTFSKPTEQTSHHLSQLGISEEELHIIRLALRDVIQSPDSVTYSPSGVNVDMSGKPATAQTGNPEAPTNSLFVGFAPFDNPLYAISVFVENGGSGSRVALALATAVLEKIQKLPPLNEAKILEDYPPLPAGKGHLKRVESLPEN